jgi:hypothetical protein
MVNVIRKPFVIPAIACAVVILWVLAWNFDPIVNGHPSYLVFYVGFLVAALAALAWAFFKPDSKGWLWLSVPGSVVLILATIGAWLLTPFAATDVALEAMTSADDVTVTATGSSITLEPTGEALGVGLVFQPGARVDSRGMPTFFAPLPKRGIGW